MDHSQDTAESVDVPATHTVDSAAAALSQAFQEEMEEEITDEEQPEGDDFDDEEDYEDEEPEEAIQAPASLTADEKAEYASLTPEAQDYVNRLEQRRSQDVTKVTTQAAEAQRAADAKAARAEQEAEARFAQQLQVIGQEYAPIEPQPSQFRDIPSYERALNNYRQQMQQHNQFMQQVSALGTETPEQRAQRIERRDRELMQIPEIANPETREKFIADAFSVAKELGYDENEVAEGMSLGDMKALAQAARWKADSETLKRIRTKSKKRPRAQDGKFRSLKPGAVQPKGNGNRQTKAQQRLERTGKVTDAQAAIKEMFSQGN